MCTNFTALPLNNLSHFLDEVDGLPKPAFLVRVSYKRKWTVVDLREGPSGNERVSYKRNKVDLDGGGLVDMRGDPSRNEGEL